MRIAIVGSGISGLVSARLLSRQHEVSVFEAADWIGGHTHTVDVEVGGKAYAVDTGLDLPELHSSDGPTRGGFQADRNELLGQRASHRPGI